MVKKPLSFRKKLKVLVIGGGLSSEHEVSLKTSRMVAENLDVQEYDVKSVIIQKDRKWKFGKGKPLELGAAITKIGRANFDFVFIALHGAFGEDGRIQALLEWIDLPYVGSGVLASALAMDKQMTNIIYSTVGLRVPPSVVLNGPSAKVPSISFPVVVKPVDGGSSVGVSIVKKKEELALALKTAFKESRRVMLQKYIKGKELTCGVIESAPGEAFALLPTEIVPRVATFFDYHEKYAMQGSLEITPARIPEAQIREVQKLALSAHGALGCRGMSRSDFILDDKKFYILETNTIPGMTEASLLPKAAAAIGISFPSLLDLIIDSGLKRFR